MKKLFYLLAFTFSLTALQAQESTSSSGGEATGEGGSVSYSVGQVTYSTHSGTAGSISEGVQQPYEISVIIGIEESGMSLNISAFPNPTTNYLILKIDDDVIQEIRFTMALYDVNGRIIKNQVIVSSETSIDMADQKAGVYFLKVNNIDQEVNTFKIVKQ